MGIDLAKVRNDLVIKAFEILHDPILVVDKKTDD